MSDAVTVDRTTTESRTPSKVDENVQKERYATLLQRLDSMSTKEISSILEGFKTMQAGASNDEGLKKLEFKTLISDVLEMSKHKSGIEILFQKIVPSPSDSSISTVTQRITEEMFLNFVLHRMTEQEMFAKMNLIPFQDQPIFKHNLYSKYSPCKLLPAVTLPSIFTVSKDGVITTWSAPSLSIQKATVADDKASMVSRSQLARLKRSSLWITDSVLMTSVNVLVISTTSRELNFYDVSSSTYKCQARLCDLPRVPLCMNSYTNSSGATYVIYGDENGNIVVMLFRDPSMSLFVPRDSRDVVSALDTIQMVLFTRLADHAKFVSVCVLDGVHPGWIRRVVYIPDNQSIISCCNFHEQSLVYRHVANKRKPYVFNLSKGISCFDFSYDLNLLVTGSADHVVRFWDPYVTTRPIAILNQHRTPIVDVLIHKDLGIVFTLSDDASICVWGIKDHTLLQMTMVKFPFSQRQPDFGHYPFHLLTPSVLTVACNEFIAEYKLGISRGVMSDKGGWDVVSHPKPLTAAVYDSTHQQVISGCEGSELSIWDLRTGAKIHRFKEAHGMKEVTCLEMDSCGRVLSGSSNGEIKLWNHIGRECLKRMCTPGNVEVTGIAHYLHDGKGKFLAGGWNKRITCFIERSDLHIFDIEPQKEAWRNSNIYKDDITCMAVCGQLKALATGSFDGHIIVWGVESERVIVKLRTSIKKNIHKLSQRRRSSSASSESSSSSVHTQSSYNNGRRMSMYVIKDNVNESIHVPVDKLLFLEQRIMAEGAAVQPQVATLVSSEGGYAKFWSFPKHVKQRGSFCLASNGDERNVLAMATDSHNQYLVAGDVKGCIAIFDIKQYCVGFQSSDIDPKCVSSWQAHACEIVSVCYASHSTQALVISASADRTLRLWNTEGHYIGTFGQSINWDLTDPVTFQHPKTPWGERALSCKGVKQLPTDNEPIGEAVSIKPKVMGASGVEQQADGKPVNGKSTPVGVLSGTSSLVSSSSSLPPVIDNTLYYQYSQRASKRIENKVNRRQNFSEIDMRCTERFGGQCSPYQALQLLSIQETPIPDSLQDLLK